MNRLKSEESGWFLISAIIMILFLTALGFSIAELVSLQYDHTHRETYVQNAQLVAEAGIEQSVEQLNSNSSFGGYTTAQTFFDNTTQGKGTFVTSIVTNPDGTSKTITSTGNVYRNDTATSPYITLGVKATVVGTTSTGFSVATGPGGLILDGTAAVTNSNVYVDGTLNMQGTSSIGTQQNPVTVDVANIACPTGSNPGPSYPQLCTNGSQPISMSNNVQIFGSVCATGQTSTGPNNNIQGGNGGAGLESGCTAPTVTQPFYDRSGIISAIPVGNIHSGTGGSYACSNHETINLSSNTELTGSTVHWGKSCTINISGNVYIPGNLLIDGSVNIVVSNSAATTRPVILVDGTITVSGSETMQANTNGTGLDYVSFANSTGNPGATPTGTDLYNSQQQINVSVGGSGKTAGMIFDAYWSEVKMTGGGHVGAAAGQTVYLKGTGSVVFGTQLTSGVETWSITSYQPLF